MEFTSWWEGKLPECFLMSPPGLRRLVRTFLWLQLVRQGFQGNWGQEEWWGVRKGRQQFAVAELHLNHVDAKLQKGGEFMETNFLKISTFIHEHRTLINESHSWQHLYLKLFLTMSLIVNGFAFLDNFCLDKSLICGIIVVLYVYKLTRINYYNGYEHKAVILYKPGWTFSKF